MIYDERWFQVEAVNSVFNYYDSGKSGNPLVCMPTGTGKSVVIGQIIRRIFSFAPNHRMMMLTHVKKLIEQNAEKLLNLWPNAPFGIYSAGLNSRETIMPIIFGGVQSVAKEIQRALKDGRQHFGWRDAVLIDEAHLLSPDEDSAYQFVISELKKINPYLKVIGFTATPYRMKQGMLTEGGIFTDICYDITDVNSFNRLIEEGYMAMLLAKPTETVIDLSKVGIVGGEFNQKQLEEATDQDAITIKACREMAEYGWNRHAWIVFGSSIKNAEHINEELQGLGIISTVVHSKLKDCDRRIEDYKNGMYQCLVNKDMLTTGFDHPPIDFIGDLQATMSPGKHVQKLGRGTRPSRETNKINCVVLDFAGNVRRIGPINDPKKPRKPGKATGDIPIKVCPQCECYNHASSRFCSQCGLEFKFEVKIEETAGTDVVVRTNENVIETFTVKKVIYNLHEKKDSQGRLTSPPSIKVSYFCDRKRIDEWILPEHPRGAERFRDWWQKRYNGQIPFTTAEALRLTSQLRMPQRIQVITNRQFPEVIGHEF